MWISERELNPEAVIEYADSLKTKAKKILAEEEKAKKNRWAIGRGRWSNNIYYIQDYRVVDSERVSGVFTVIVELGKPKISKDDFNEIKHVELLHESRDNV